VGQYQSQRRRSLCRRCGETRTDLGTHQDVVAPDFLTSDNAVNNLLLLTDDVALVILASLVDATGLMQARPTRAVRREVESWVIALRGAGRDERQLGQREPEGDVGSEGLRTGSKAFSMRRSVMNCRHRRRHRVSTVF
jgi:hypothetical protein